MNVALVDVDGRNFPNLALMKISAWHKSQGDHVEWYTPLFSEPDRIYASKVFTFTPDYLDYAPTHPEPVRGGTGYDPAVKLPDEVETIAPDFSLYPQYQAAYGFLTRGCIRQCPWCIVPRKEGAIRAVCSIEKVAAGRREVILMDNNFLAAEPLFIERQLTVAAQLKLKLDFNQGLDARLVTPRYAKLLAACGWIENIRFSCDNMTMIEPFRRAISLIREAGCNRRIFCYMLIQDVEEAEVRLRALVELGVTPFAQPYRDYSNNEDPTEEQKLFARFANVKGGRLCLKMKFKDYKHA